MRIPLSWLAEFVVLAGLPTAALADRLTMAGLEVEAIEEVGELDRAHPRGGDRARSSRIRGRPAWRCAGSRRGDGQLTVVSAAPGLAAGHARGRGAGGRALPGGTAVAAADAPRRRLGAACCARESELELGRRTDRVLELPGAAPGTALRDLPGVRDTVLELDITPTAATAVDARRRARAGGGARAARASRAPRSGSAVRRRPSTSACASRRRTCARCTRRASCAACASGRRRSPVRLRLRRAGMRPINDVVDATNFVMLERGPAAARVRPGALADGQIVVRRARRGETLATLDGVERRARAGRPGDRRPARCARAGRRDGRRGQRGQGRRRATSLLESAFFPPAAVRRTGAAARAHVAGGLPLRAPGRSRGRARRARRGRGDRSRGWPAARSRRAHRGGAGRRDARAAPDPLARPARVAALLGVPLRGGELRRRLRALGMTLQRDGEPRWSTPPTWRGDLEIEEDLVEEVGAPGRLRRHSRPRCRITATGADEGERAPRSRGASGDCWRPRD